MKRVVVQVNERNFYRSFLEVLKSRMPISKLRPKEMDVLAEMMYQHSLIQNKDDESKYDILFSTRMRKAMRENIGISEESFNNNLSTLRKLGLITRDNKLNKAIEDVVFDDTFILEFYFKKA